MYHNHHQLYPKPTLSSFKFEIMADMYTTFKTQHIMENMF